MRRGFLLGLPLISVDIHAHVMQSDRSIAITVTEEEEN